MVPPKDASFMLTAAEAEALNQRFGRAAPEEVLAWAWERFGTRGAIGTSFQGAGLVMLHLCRERGYDFPVFTLDTGLHFPETVELKSRLEKFFGITIEPLHPDLTVEQQAEAQGPELWKSNPDLCCTLRKVLPLQDKLSTLDCWITGLRRQQSDTRTEIGVVELYVFDKEAGRDIVKLNPMANRSRSIPYNPLHDRGYRSIGCAPCTGKSDDAKNERAGRWVGFNKAECGIHTFLSRKVDFQI
jgi:phosphoadenosine phosphosulfate reductase